MPLILPLVAKTEPDKRRREQRDSTVSAVAAGEVDIAEARGADMFAELR
jgi:hypothetical protein